MELCTPTTLSGVALAVPLQLDRKADGNFIYFIEMGRVYALLLVSYALTLFLLLSLWEVALDGVGADDYECVHGKLKVQFACVFLYEASIFGTLLKDIDFLRLILNAQDPGSAGHLSLASSKEHHGAVLIEEKKGHMSSVMNKFRPAPPPDMPEWNFHGMNTAYRAFCVVLLGLPKICFTAALGFLGALFILGCDNIADIVLNAMAVNFVLEVDTVLYESFISGGTKGAIEHMKSVEIEVTQGQRVFSWLVSTVFYPLITLTITLYMVIVEAGCGLHYVPQGNADTVQMLKIPFVKPAFMEAME